MNTFVETQFPTDIAYGASGGPEFSTDIIETFGGHEQRNINWSEARAKFNVAHGVKTQVQLDVLIAFFRARRGRAIGFRFKDWSDYQGINQALGTGNGSNKDFQLVKIYTSGAVQTTRIIKKPVNNAALKIYKDSVLQVSGYTVNFTTGLVSFGTAPANSVAISADFEFDVPVRFDTDRLSISLESYGIGSWGDVPLVEIRI